ncbi:hypothetical protein BgiMline_009928, partial [Biomphalaria glabrata]
MGACVLNITPRKLMIPCSIARDSVIDDSGSLATALLAVEWVMRFLWAVAILDRLSKQA